MARATNRPAGGTPRTRAPRAPLVSVRVSAGALELSCDGVPMARAAEVAALLDAQLTAALQRAPALRAQVDTVPGGSLPYVDDGDWGERAGRQRPGRGIGFTG